MSNNMRIAISGKSGCGNTTVTGLLAEQLEIPMINYTFRNLAAHRGVSFNEIRRQAEESDDIDRYLDNHQVELAMQESACVLGSRLAIWMLKEADLKVYLLASEEERARRVHTREEGDFQAKLQETQERDLLDTARYKRIYGIDNNDYTEADLVIDTDKKSPDEIVACIIQALTERGFLQT